MKNLLLIFLITGLFLADCSRPRKQAEPYPVPTAGPTRTAPDRAGYYEPDFSGDEYEALSHYMAGNRYFEKCQFYRAEQEYKKALEIAPGSRATYLSLARAYFEQEKLPEEKDTLEKLLDLYPDEGYGRWMLGEILLKEEKYDEAIEQLKLSASQGEGKLYSIEAYLLLGYACYLKGDYNRALIELNRTQELLEQFCADPELRLTIGSMLGMMIFAEDYFEYNLPLQKGKPGELSSSLKKAQELVNSSRYDEALVETRKALVYLKRKIGKKVNIPPPAAKFEAGDTLPDRDAGKK